MGNSLLGPFAPYLLRSLESFQPRSLGIRGSIDDVLFCLGNGVGKILMINEFLRRGMTFSEWMLFVQY